MKLTSLTLAAIAPLLAALPDNAHARTGHYEPEDGHTIRYVAKNGSDSGDCANADKPCATISFAIGVASSGDAIEIADGEYTESLEIDKSLTLRGESRSGTIVQAHEEPAVEIGRVINIDGNYEVDISELTLRHGNMLGGGGLVSIGATLLVSNVTVSDNIGGFSGGGMHLAGGETILTNVIFSRNLGFFGGGITLAGGSASLTNVTFEGNQARRGGGLYSQDAFASLSNTRFIDNDAIGTEFEEGGGGMFTTGGNCVLRNVDFHENSAVRGGGLRIHEGNAVLRFVRFVGNQASGFGGGVYASEGNLSARDSLFHANTVTGGDGGGLFNMTGAQASLFNVVFSGNGAQQFGGGIRNANTGHSVLRNTIVWGNSAGSGGNEISNGLGSSELHYSLHAGGPGDIEPGGGFSCNNCVVNEDPRFVAPGSGNLRLMEGSPAIDAGDPDTAFLLPPGESFPIDLDGNPRVAGAAIDMGPYEWQPPKEIFRDRFEE